MTDRLLVGTRKGLLVFEREGAGWRAGPLAFAGTPVSMALHDARTGTLYAALAHGHFGCKLHRSDDGGASWREIAVPAYPAADGEDAPAVELIWSLEAAGPGALWAGTIPGGLFRSDDAGESWALNAPLWAMPERARWFGGGYDHPGIHSIAVDPGDPRCLTVAVSCGGVWRTEDGGDSWEPRCDGMVAPYVPPESAGDPTNQDPHRLVLCAGAPDHAWVQHHAGLYRSADGLASWTRVAEPAVSDFGFAVAVDPNDPSTAWFVPAEADERRYPVGARLVVTRTRDGGRSFEVLDRGLPDEPTYDLVYRHGLDVDATGRRLAMGSTTGGLWVSENAGDDWTCLGRHLPPIYAVRFA